MRTEEFFSNEEYLSRLAKVRQAMEEREMEALLVSSPENIYYLAGLNHQGHFAVQLLIVALEGDPLLITRAMEKVTVQDQVLPRARWCGFADSADPALFAAEVIEKEGFGGRRLGIEKDHMFLPPRVYEKIIAAVPKATWLDGSGLVEEIRLVKSDREIAYVREAAKATDAAVSRAIEVAAEGLTLREIAAEVYRAMILAGGDYPGFTPLIRSTPTLGEEHETWTDYTLKAGDPLFIELSGCKHRYHAPAMRLVHIGYAPPGTEEMARLCLAAGQAVQEAIRPGTTAGAVFQAWQDVVDRAGLSHYRRHHCGYTLGIGFPPSWVGGSRVAGLAPGSTMEIRTGMVFHLLFWLSNTGRPGDYFLSDAAVLTRRGLEVLTTVSRKIHIKS